MAPKKLSPEPLTPERLDYSIGELSKRCGVKVVTIRYYEQNGLMPEPRRSPSGQRRYTDLHIQRLGFIRHARELGFAPEAVQDLLNLADHPTAPCDNAHNLAQKHLDDIENRIADLERLRDELQIMSKCHEQDAGHCKILEAIGDFDHGHCQHEQH